MTTPTPTYIAKRFEASSPDAKVLGAAFVAFFQNVRKDVVTDVMKQLGLETIDPDAWYPQQTFLNFYKVAETDSSMMNDSFVAIGMKFVDTIPFPEDVETIQEALHALNAMNEQIHQNTPPEECYIIEDESDNSIIVKYNMPYHEDAAYGYLWGIARRFSPQGFEVIPIHDEVDDAPFAFRVQYS
ncbi:MAG: hypothetical protein ACFE0Q_08735 [Anaerolineae bacterium]